MEWKWAPVSRCWVAVDPTGFNPPLWIPDPGGSEDGPTEEALVRMAKLEKGDQPLAVA